jgi:hypothetical protein
VELYYAVGAEQGMKMCARCGRPFGMQMHVQDVKSALRGGGFNFYMPEEKVWWQDYCARCKRVIRGTAYAGSAGRGWINPGNLQRSLYARPTAPVAELDDEGRGGEGDADVRPDVPSTS